jgi:hypothetical protein
METEASTHVTPTYGRAGSSAAAWRRWSLVVIVISVVLAACASPGSSATTGSPTTAAAIDLPAEFLYAWIGETRLIPDLGAAQDRSIIEFTPGEGTSFQYHAGEISVLASQVSAFSDDQIELTSIANDSECSTGDIGSYHWAMSAGGGTLTLTEIEDGCPTRLLALPGSWARAACENPDIWCLGDLEAGEHLSTYFAPLLPADDEWVYYRGAMSYTTPAGWSNSVDLSAEYVLRGQSAPDDSGIFMWSDVVIVNQADPCIEAPEPTVERTAAAMADWIANAPGVVSTVPLALAIGGIEGLTLDISMDPTWTESCPYTEGRPYFPIFTGSATGTGLHWGVQPDTHMRLYILDRGDDTALVIAITAEDQATYEDLLDEATTIVESIQFRP